MSQGSNADKRQRTADGDQEDPLNALPEDLLHHILSFLPSRDLVQKTCILAKRWRYRWKSVPALRISQDTAFQNADDMTKFVNNLIVLRGHNPLVECEINFWHQDETFFYLDVWIRYAMLCKVQILRMTNHLRHDHDYCLLPDKALDSNNLTVLELYRVESDELLLDFSRCSALQDLKIGYSKMDVTRILSPSVKKLTVCNCIFPWDDRVQISVPNLNVLSLTMCRNDPGLIPFLDNMPQLVSASIRHGTIQHDCCKSRFEIGGCTDASCRGCAHKDGEGNKSVLLVGLSCALHLELLASSVEMFIFRRDLTLYPEFSKLKTLVVNDWCMVANAHALIFFLQHSPALEKLTLLIYKDDDNEVTKKANYEGTKQSSMSFKQLIVEVKCKKISEKLKKILEILVTCGVPRGQIKIYLRSPSR